MKKNISSKTKILFSILLTLSAQSLRANDDVISLFDKFAAEHKNDTANQVPEAAKPSDSLPVEKLEAAVAKEETAVVETEKAPQKKKVKKKIHSAKINPSTPNPSSKENPPADREPAAVRNSVITHTEVPAAEEAPSTLTGDWGGKRKMLSDKGLDLTLLYKAELSRDMAGGLLRQEGTLEEIDIKLNIDAEKLFNAKGLSMFIFGLGSRGEDKDKKPSANVGDLQGVSNIEAKTDDFKLYEAWLQQKFLDERVSLLFGLHDLNTEFYVTDTSGLFFNSSFGVGKELSQTGVNGPSIFPYPTTSLRLRVEPTKNTYLMSAVFDAQAGNPNALKGTHIRAGSADGFLLINETGAAKSGDDPYKYALGYWIYTRTFDHLSETVTTGSGATVPSQVSSSGMYILMDQSFLTRFSAFLRYGLASTLSNQVKDNLSAGIVAKGLIPSRKDDKLGIAVTRVTPGSEYIEQMKKSGTSLAADETAYELSYRIELASGLALQPDLQYISNPGLSETNNFAIDGAIRIELNF